MFSLFIRGAHSLPAQCVTLLPLYLPRLAIVKGTCLPNKGHDLLGKAI